MRWYMATGQRQRQPTTHDYSPEARFFYNSLNSNYTRANYKVYLEKYFKTVGYSNGLANFKSKSPKEIENDLIEFIISLKERGCKRETIGNYVKPILAFCKVNDIILNSVKIRRFVPPGSRNKKTRAYSVEEIQKLLDIGDERMKVVILLASSACLRIGAIPALSIGSLESVPEHDLYRITVYEGEPESYITYCSNECRKAIDSYLSMRKIYGEDIENNRSAPLIREQFDKRDPFSIAHPQRIKEVTLRKILVNMSESAGIRTHSILDNEQRHRGASKYQRKDIPICNGFRYFYITTLINSGLQAEHRYLLEGHNLKFNDMFYERVSDNVLLKSYLLAHNNLIIDQTHKLRQRVEQLEVEKTAYEALAAKVASLEKRIQ
jgi:hypothetical protein